MKNNNDLLKRVQEALGKDSKLRNCIDNIYILVNDGAVIMAGSVTHESLKNIARKIVSNVSGVNLLIEDLKVESIKPHRVSVQIDWAKEDLALV